LRIRGHTLVLRTRQTFNSEAAEVHLSRPVGKQIFSVRLFIMNGHLAAQSAESETDEADSHQNGSGDDQPKTWLG
jgi:hypothetical protein